MAPWKPHEGLSETQNKERVAKILTTCAEAIRIITALVYPVIPEAAMKVWRQLGLGDITQADLKDLRWGGYQPGTKLGELGPVFPRAEKEAIERMQEMEDKRVAQLAVDTGDKEQAKNPTSQGETWGTQAAQPRSKELVAAETGRAQAHVSELQSVGTMVAAAQTVAATPQVSSPAPAAQASSEQSKIGIEDFAKVELRVAVIRVAERVPKADRLLRLEVDLGYEQRQIVAGIAEAYAPESLIGRKVVIVANLAPRKLRGLESNGMIVAASVGEKGTPVLAGFLEDVEIGARLK